MNIDTNIDKNIEKKCINKNFYSSMLFIVPSIYAY